MTTANPILGKVIAKRYATAISGFARSAAAELAPQMLDSWKQADASAAPEERAR